MGGGEGQDGGGGGVGETHSATNLAP
jgi:hypothetical protein